MNSINLENPQSLADRDIDEDWCNDSVPPNVKEPKEIYVTSRYQSSRNNLIPNVCRAVRIPGTHKVEILPVIVSHEASESSKTFDCRGSWSAFLDNARRLDNQGKTDAALDLIFDQIDEMMLAGQFAKVDQILKNLVPDNYSVELLLGLLTITSPAKNILTHRQEFFQQVEQTLHRRGENEDGLLFGLS